MSRKPRQTVKVCPTCGTSFSVKNSHASRRAYCSRPCMSAAYRTRLKGEGNPNHGTEARVCCWCSAEFRSYNPRQRYCAITCYFLYRAQKAANKPTSSATRQTKASPSPARLRVELRELRARMVEAKKAERERLRAERIKKARERRIAKSRVCLSCGGLSGKYHWCMTCRLLGRHRVPPRTSTCTVCSATVPVRNRKYCDRCWRDWMRSSRGTPRRTDANHAEIVAALRQAGCSVADLSHVGRGFPDIVVWSQVQDRMHLMEIKTPKGKLNKRQQEWFDKWGGPKPHVVRSVEEALAVVGIRVSA